MRIDVHTHIFPPDIVLDRSRFFDGEPAFRLLYDSPRARLATAESLIEAMDRDEVACAVVFGFPWQSPELASRHNDAVLEAAARHAPRLVPLACVDPLARGSVDEAQRCLESGAAGLGELALYGACDPKTAEHAFEGLIALCKAHKHVLMVHANEPVGHVYPGKASLGLDFFYELAKLSAGIPLILAHWGGGLCFYELLKKEATDVLAHVHYDTAASPFLYRPDIYASMVRLLGREKILFGSDYPLLPPRRYFDEMAGAGLTSEELEAISGGNAARLFGLLT